jgi:transposase
LVLKNFSASENSCKGSVSIDHAKVRSEARFDGKWVLRTNTDLSAEKVALTYEELWQVERVFRDMKSLLEIRPIFHRRDDHPGQCVLQFGMCQ